MRQARPSTQRSILRLQPLLFALLLTLLPATAAIGQDAAPPDYAYNEGLERDLRSLVWEEGSRMRWNHWSDSRGVEIFHTNNDGHLRQRHMDYIRSSPNPSNMELAGPGFYIASDIRSSAHFGEELLDVRLNQERSRLIDLTNRETLTRLQEIFDRHNVPFRFTSYSDLKKPGVIDLFDRHGITGARYTGGANSTYSWTSVWNHEAIENLRRGTSAVHIEMWEMAAERLRANSYGGNNNPVDRLNSDAALKKLAEWRTDVETRAFARAVEAGAATEGTIVERFSRAFAESNFQVSTGERSVRIVDGKVAITLPADASLAQTSRAFIEASMVAELHSRNAELASRTFGPNAERNAGADLLRENTRLRAMRMTEGLVASDAELRSRLATERVEIERSVMRSHQTIEEFNKLRSDIKSRHGVDLPPTRFDRYVEAFKFEFNPRNLHVEPQVFYEERGNTRQQFSRSELARKLRANAQSGRAIFDGISDLSIFAQEGRGGLNSLYERYNVGPDASREMIDRFVERARRHGAVVEFVASGDPRLQGNAQARTFVGENGQIKVVLPADRPIKRFALIDELTHVRQFSNMARATNIEEVRQLLERADRGDRAAREVLTRWEIQAKKNVLLTMDANDPARRTVQRSIEALELSRDPYITARRGNGTINWSRVTRSVGGGLAHFTLALFLKELAVVIETGDRAAITHFFNGLLTTDFYLNYGLFSAGAYGAQVIYTRGMEQYLTRYIRPRFVNSILKMNVVLAAGMALPMAVMGHWDGKAFAIELTGLGLSSMAVKAGIAGVQRAASLATVRGGSSVLARLGRMGRLTNVAGWVYSAVELAVILYVGDKIARRIEAEVAIREARSELNDARDRFRALLSQEGLTEEQLNEGIMDLHAAYIRYRNFLYEPLRDEEARLMSELSKLTTRVGGRDETVEEWIDRAEREPERFGNLRALAERLREQYAEQNQTEVEEIFRAYEQRRDALINEIYRGEREGDSLNPASASDAWALLGGTSGAAGDPLNGRNDLGARLNRWQSRRDFNGRFSRSTGNRMETYDDESSLLRLAATALGDSPLRGALEEAAGRVVGVRDQERALVLGEGPLAGRSRASRSVDVSVDSIGLIRALARARDGGTGMEDGQAPPPREDPGQSGE